MHSTLRISLTAVLLVSLLASCGTTPPSNYYILRAHALPPSSSSSMSIGIGPIRVPEYLQTNVLATSQGGNRLDFVKENRWAEPLEAGINRVLSLNLAGLLQTQDVHSYPWNPRLPPDYALKVQVLELEATATHANLVVEWVLLRATDETSVRRRISQFSTALENTQAETIASAYSELFYQLSELTAATIRQVADETTAQKSSP